MTVVVGVCALAVGGASPAAAQSAVRGSVVDPSGAAVPGVLVRVERGLVGYEAITGGDGRFLIERVPPGPVRLSAVLSGFRPVHREVAVSERDERELLITLEPASLAETVTVVAEGRTYRPHSATTDTKLDLPLIETPQSVTVIPSKVVEDRQVLRMGELADNVASVRASPGYGGLSSANYYMRGFRGSFSGGLDFHVRDPDGNVISFVQYRAFAARAEEGPQ